MHAFVTSKNVKWCHLIWPTLYYWWSQLRISGQADAPPPRGERPVYSGRPVHTIWIIGLCWAKLASSTSPQKPPATYRLIRGSVILDQIQTQF